MNFADIHADCRLSRTKRSPSPKRDRYKCQFSRTSEGSTKKGTCHGKASLVASGDSFDLWRGQMDKVSTAPLPGKPPDNTSVRVQARFRGTCFASPPAGYEKGYSEFSRALSGSSQGWLSRRPKKQKEDLAANWDQTCRIIRSRGFVALLDKSRRHRQSSRRSAPS